MKTSIEPTHIAPVIPAITPRTALHEELKKAESQLHDRLLEAETRIRNLEKHWILVIERWVRGLFKWLSD